MVNFVNKILLNVLNRFNHLHRIHKRKGPFCELQEWAFLSHIF